MISKKKILLALVLLLGAALSAQGQTSVVCGGVDDTAALQAAITAAPRNSTLAIHGPLCIVSASLTSVQDQGLNVVGDGPGAGIGGGTMIRGYVTGPVFDFAPGSGTGTGGSFRSLSVRNTSPAGIGIRYGNFTSAKIESVFILAYRGIVCAGNNYSLLIDTVRLLGPSPVTPGSGSIGILASGHTTVLNADIIGFDNGVRAYGTTVNVIGCRIEVNVIGLLLGVKDDGTGWILSRSSIAGNSFEANDESIHVSNLVGSSIRDSQIQGSVGSPSHQSLYGIRILGGSLVAVEISAIHVGGTHSVASFSATGAPRQVTFNTLTAENGLPAPALAWDVPNPAAWTFINTNYTQ